jgi:hypothetical protein
MIENVIILGCKAAAEIATTQQMQEGFEAVSWICRIYAFIHLIK